MAARKSYPFSFVGQWSVSNAQWTDIHRIQDDPDELKDELFPREEFSVRLQAFPFQSLLSCIFRQISSIFSSENRNKIKTVKWITEKWRLMSVPQRSRPHLAIMIIPTDSAGIVSTVFKIGLSAYVKWVSVICWTKEKKTMLIEIVAPVKTRFFSSANVHAEQALADGWSSSIHVSLCNFHDEKTSVHCPSTQCTVRRSELSSKIERKRVGLVRNRSGSVRNEGSELAIQLRDIVREKSKWSFILIFSY